MERKPKIAILRWEQGLVPEGLKQLEQMPGNSTNEASYPFPVKMIPIEGACTETIITNPSKEVLNRMIDTAKDLVENEGIEAITTSCGFNAIFQREMANALSVPVFSSSLMQVPFVQNMIGKSKSIIIITANKGSLTKEHFEACGIGEDVNYKVYGLEECKEWNKIFENPDERFDVKTVEADIIGTAERAVKENPDAGAIVLECTDLPPFAKKINEKVGLPVFDINSLMGYIGIVVGELKMY